MIYISKFKITLILLACLMAFVYAAPNVLSQATRDALATRYAGWMPIKGVSLGLDLRGGSHLLLQVDLDSVMREKMDDLAQSIRAQFKDDKITGGTVSIQPSAISVSFDNADMANAARASVRKVEQGLIVEQGALPSTVRVTYDDMAWKQVQTQILAQSIEIVRRRVDESGTKESTIARQGDDRILVQIPGLDDPSRIKDLLGRTAKLSFHLVDDGMSPGASSKMLPLQEYPGEKMAVLRRAILTGDMLVQAAPSFDQNSQPVVSFRLNSTGARRFCDVTRDHTGKPFAIVLDGVVISAPRINEPICGGSAQISGNFTVQESADLSLLLRAGALPAPLQVIEERTVGPSLGSDSVAAGKMAAVIGLILVIILMMAAYGLFGVFAAAALVINIIMIFAVLSFLGATLTLPGIAGIVLTIGMAVDANVLIFERIREETRAGKSPVVALESGYARAFDTIVDSNLTTLIAALVLFLLGAGPIKGFAITLSIGILTSIFTAVMVTRLMVVAWFSRTRPKILTV
jgi:preprotein translocase subunit SecD